MGVGDLEGDVTAEPGGREWIVKAAGPDAEAATALNTSAFNFAIAFGALIGGVALVAWLTTRDVAPASTRVSS